jgi:hypothetical protein
MPELPSHPETSRAHSTDAAAAEPIAGFSRARKVLLAAAVVGLVVLFAVLHLTGVVGGGEGH